MTTTIPNTNYSIQNNQIMDPDGNAITKEAFVNQVKSKEIALTGPALKMLGDTFGEEYQTELGKTSKVNSEALAALKDKLDATTNTAGDIMLQVLEMIHKAEQTNKQAQRDMANANVQLQKEKINEQADKMKDAAMWQMGMGLASAALQFTASAVQVSGGMKALKLDSSQQGTISAMSTKYQGYAGMINSLGAAVKAGGDGIAGVKNAEAKQVEGEQVEAQHMTEEHKKMRDNADETEKKAREALQAVLQARDQAMSKAVNMS